MQYFRDMVGGNGIRLYENRNIELSPQTAYLIINSLTVEEVPVITYNASLVMFFNDLRINYTKLMDIITKVIKKLLVLGCRDIEVVIHDENEEKVNLRVEINFVFKEFINNQEIMDLEV